MKLFLSFVCLKIFCSILPYSRSVDDTLLTYELPEEFRESVQIGSAVIVPWGDDEIIGIIADINEKGIQNTEYKIQDLHQKKEIKAIIRPVCSIPLFAPHEIAMITHIAHTCFLRLHTVAQLFFPLGLFQLFEKEHFLSLVSPVVPTSNSATSEYIVAPDETAIQTYLTKHLSQTGGAMILPDGSSASAWNSLSENTLLDTHSRSISAQKKIYLSILQGNKKILFGTRRTLLKRIGHYTHIYIIYDNLPGDIFFENRNIPFWMLVQALEQQGHVIHYMTTSPSIRIFSDFLQTKKPIIYL